MSYRIVKDQSPAFLGLTRDEAIRRAQLMHSFPPESWHEVYGLRGGCYQLKPGDCHQLIGGDGCLGCPNIYGAMWDGQHYRSCKHAERQSREAEEARR